jgi:XTP/dITP diphosphohydrolase
MDDVPTAQPALALAQKVIERVRAAGLPSDLIPADITTVTVAADVDSENTLRSAVLEFMDTVRRTEQAIVASRRGADVPQELDVAPLGDITEDEWRAYWPSGDAEAAEVTDDAEDTEPAPDRIPEPAPVEVPEPTPADVPEPGPVETPDPAPQDAEDAAVTSDNTSESAGQTENPASIVESR